MTRADSRVQLSVTGKGERLSHVLLPAIVSGSLLATCGEAGPPELSPGHKV